MIDPRADTTGPDIPSTALTRLLIVDDEPAPRRLLARMLEAAGYFVQTAPGGKEALELAVSESPDVVLLDFQMPGLNGVEVCAALRHHAQALLRGIPIIMLTAHDGEAEEVACLHAGANDFVAKPVARATLIARIETQLRLRAMNTVLRAQKDELERWRTAQVADLEAGQQVQRAILPVASLEPGWRLSTHYAPLIQVGGDIYGVETTRGPAMLWLADATGHGVAAALCTTLVTILFQRAAFATDDPQEVLARVNSGLFAIFRGKTMMSGLCARISGDGEICFAGAGHPPLLVRRSDGRVESVESRSTLLGIRESFSGAAESVRLEHGDSALFFTDGLFSARKAGRVRQVHTDVTRVFSREAELPALVEAMGGNGTVDDDVTALLLHRE